MAKQSNDARKTWQSSEHKKGLLFPTIEGAQCGACAFKDCRDQRRHEQSRVRVGGASTDKDPGRLAAGVRDLLGEHVRCCDGVDGSWVGVIGG
jgi:hypothetical protein